MQLKLNTYSLKNILGIISGMFFLCLIVSSCENDLDNIAKLTTEDTSADELSDSLTIVYTDSAKVKFIVFGEKVEKFNKPKEMTIINDGLKVEFFDTDGSQKAILTSQYGEIKQDKGTFICKYDVVFKNIEKDQTLFTEELQWNQKTKKIFTPGNVTIQKEDDFLYGIGMEANEDFSWYKIIEPTAKVITEKDSTEHKESIKKKDSSKYENVQ